MTQKIDFLNLKDVFSLGNILPSKLKKYHKNKLFRRLIKIKYYYV